MTEQKLKTCPFCGGKANYINFDDKYNLEEHIECKKCGAGITNYDEGKDVTENWNTRASTTREAELQAEVERLRKLLKEADEYLDFTGEAGDCHTIIKQALNQED